VVQWCGGAVQCGVSLQAVQACGSGAARGGSVVKMYGEMVVADVV